MSSSLQSSCRFRQDRLHSGLLYLSLQGSRATGSGPGNPRINTFSATTEAPDETARGEWLDLVARAGDCAACGHTSQCHTHCDAGPCHEDCVGGGDPEFARALEDLVGATDLHGLLALLVSEPRVRLDPTTAALQVLDACHPLAAVTGVPLGRELASVLQAGLTSRWRLVPVDIWFRSHDRRASPEVQ